MKTSSILWLALGLCACSKHLVRCDTRLEPINAPRALPTGTPRAAPSATTVPPAEGQP
jgi:hypothetical protein